MSLALAAAAWYLGVQTAWISHLDKRRWRGFRIALWQWLKAMAIWLPELPDVQLMQFYHRLPMNLTYWKGYPTKDNPYVNPAFFHSTYGLVLHNLEATT